MYIYIYIHISIMMQYDAIKLCVCVDKSLANTVAFRLEAPCKAFLRARIPWIPWAPAFSALSVQTSPSTVPNILALLGVNLPIQTFKIIPSSNHPIFWIIPYLHVTWESSIQSNYSRRCWDCSSISSASRIIIVHIHIYIYTYIYIYIQCIQNHPIFFAFPAVQNLGAQRIVGSSSRVHGAPGA